MWVRLIRSAIGVQCGSSGLVLGNCIGAGRAMILGLVVNWYLGVRPGRYMHHRMVRRHYCAGD